MRRMPKKVAYCTLDPEFPEKAYMIFLFILHNDQIVGTLPLDAIYDDTDHAADGVKQIIEQLESSQKPVTVPHECILIPITKYSLFPLKKEYWKKPSISYNEQTRIISFRPVLNNPSLFALLVTPYSYDDTVKKWYLHAAMPLANEKDVKPVERFMQVSDYVVEPRAKFAAIYTIGEKMRFNWNTKEVKTFERHQKESEVDN